ncbi:MAG: hypothetical protein COZ06_24270 [Armatimonadetes bacterium CG_4_10_14_3_um_filter_66_18]|nr:hypothetical protein [Armatimonadota bacterium]OIP04710.1 MAG: hypothetical protein AUJ96_12145 [Armatimonadetes bacterium CG2_30_66_41]PIU93248.1 MAG: hypothetical protein COS65_13775 [Armatimonadetes bacterium CG06_land_8_20_14_3_00_66_21]PIW15135.1 MAG: hypothetical protein COW34_06930 [Armatimonadetes bacterium CG17_big_fil_post_rev_8_21_14_2_50_66_6]PIX48623.1 MAG: hypothetical protein COZ57_05060 [Armatimonadetes bacterium CG_4_8_14_3_um_filter_66_20]PIY42877.1 MAG: hypothetical prote
MGNDDSTSKGRATKALQGRAKAGKICGLAAKGKVKKMAKKAKGAAYLCERCGYVSADQGDLCRPLEL